MPQKSDKITLFGRDFSQTFFESKTSNGTKNNVYLFALFLPVWPGLDAQEIFTKIFGNILDMGALFK